MSVEAYKRFLFQMPEISEREVLGLFTPSTYGRVLTVFLMQHIYKTEPSSSFVSVLAMALSSSLDACCLFLSTVY